MNNQISQKLNTRLATLAYFKRAIAPLCNEQAELQVN